MDIQNEEEYQVRIWETRTASFDTSYPGRSLQWWLKGYSLKVMTAGGPEEADVELKLTIPDGDPMKELDASLFMTVNQARVIHDALRKYLTSIGEL